MTLKKFKARTKRKTISELQQLEENLQNTLKVALQIYMESENSPNEEDIKYLRQLGRKMQITQQILHRKLHQ